jgi:BNR/Asp-box repeat
MSIPRLSCLTTKPCVAAAGIVALVASAMLVSAAATPQVLPVSPGTKVTILNRRPGAFSEPSIAINPQNPKQVLAAFQTPASVAYSEDSGEHWQLVAGAAPENYKRSGDVSVAYDILGHAYLCYIAFDKLGTTNYWAHDATRNGVFVRRSLDGGKTWEANAAPVDEQPTHPDMLFEDKPHLISDNNPGSPYAGTLYAGWTEFSLTKSIILVSRSRDGGITWSLPYEISTHEGLPRDDNGSVEGFAAAVGPDGMFYAVWSDGEEIDLCTSRDGGITFAPSRRILNVAPPYFKVEGVERSNGFPQIGADPHNGRLFVTWSDYRNGDVDVFCATSPDRGRTWSAAVRVNDDSVHNGADQFFQRLAVDPSDGSAYVIFYDRRGDPANRRAVIVLARSTNAGQSFVNYSWTTSSFNLDGQFIGDYTGLAALSGQVYGAWTEPVSRGTAALAGSNSTLVKVGTANFQSRPQ